jgi:hypothetical protein
MSASNKVIPLPQYFADLDTDFVGLEKVALALCPVVYCSYNYYRLLPFRSKILRMCTTPRMF